MIDSENLNKLKIALNEIEKGEDVSRAVANAEYVNYDQTLLDKISLLKNISVLNKDLIKYLYSIQLTDKISDVAPKVNAIYQLALNANLIEDKALEDLKKEREEKEKGPKIVGKDDVSTAMNVIRAFLSINS